MKIQRSPAAVPKNLVGHMRDHVIQVRRDVRWTFLKSSAIILATSIQTSGK